MDYVAFSGGIDSTALALMCPDAVPIFTDTGWEFDEIYQHIDKFEGVTGREIVRVKPAANGETVEGETIPDYIQRRYFLPTFNARWCTRIFKIKALNDWLTTGDRLPATVSIGLRADEPASDRVGNLSSIDGLVIDYPLRTFGMGRIDCVRLCLDHDLLPRYPAYMSAGGCKGCFYKRTGEIRAMHYLIPGELDELQSIEETIQDERGDMFVMFPNLGMSIAKFRNQLNQQPMMFAVEDVYRELGNGQSRSCGLFCNR